ncbi:hypothetical protein EI534_25940 [Pseudomonas frederiksbergensis]|nr:hypothetical protein [Pseudomonas frederiksbergensis]
MKATLESTSADDRQRERREGSVLWGKTKVLLDERDSLKAEVQRLKSMVPNPAKARRDRTADVEAPIAAAVESIRAKLEAQHQVFRISAVLDHMWLKRSFYGITKLPTRTVVQRVLVNQGLYIIA